ncbi:hypothetical protein TNCV_1184341 [Trichonephila clavipes]|nr:hypothetical protein TNCV_1184341 [Trichonephila clavipes]
MNITCIVTTLDAGGGNIMDNAPFHTAGIVSRWSEELDTDFTFLSWPSQSPDFNQTENILDKIEIDIRERESSCIHYHSVGRHWKVQFLGYGLRFLSCHLPRSYKLHAKKTPCSIKGKR